MSDLKKVQQAARSELRCALKKLSNAAVQLDLHFEAGSLQVLAMVMTDDNEAMRQEYFAFSNDYAKRRSSQLTVELNAMDIPPQISGPIGEA
jgi:hypothetical protein